MHDFAVCGYVDVLDLVGLELEFLKMLGLEGTGLLKVNISSQTYKFVKIQLNSFSYNKETNEFKFKKDKEPKPSSDDKKLKKKDSKKTKKSDKTRDNESSKKAAREPSKKASSSYKNLHASFDRKGDSYDCC